MEAAQLLRWIPVQMYQQTGWRDAFRYPTLKEFSTVKKIAMAVLLAFTLLPAASFGQISVRIGPPPPVVERRPPPPGRGFVWIGGYQRWDGGRYVWVPGRWDRPPRAHAHWVAHRWVHRRGQWVFVEGHWR